jgi:hypothetical protein
MQVDPEYLRQHYDSLSDEALLAIKRSDLVEIAQKCKRGLAPLRGVRRPGASRPASTRLNILSIGETGVAVDSGDTGERPMWLARMTSFLEG